MNEEIQIVGRTGYENQTIVHPVGLFFLIVLGLCVMFFQRRWSLLPLLIMACVVSTAQRIVIAGMDFDFLRIMVLFGLTRLFFRKEYTCFIWRPLDVAIVFWTLSSMFFFILRQGDFATVVNRLGFAFDAFGMYFLFRCQIRNWEDIESIIFGAVLLSIPTMIFFIIEQATGKNIFSMFGGVPEITEIREGRIRCQGSFSHSIIAGCFWASLLPLFAGYWWKSSRHRFLTVTGTVASLIIIVCTASSTPIMGVLAAMIGGFFFFLRYRVRAIRWAVLLTLIALHMMMNIPIWHLVSRVGAVGGSTGWHRYNLINQTILNFRQWWFDGCSGNVVEGWGVYAGDVTNQYLLEGIKGGFFTLCCFVAIIIFAFREVGMLWRLQVRNPYRLMMVWLLGVSLFVHCTNFIGVAYFGQIWILWYMVLAMIGSLSAQAICFDVKNHTTCALPKRRPCRNQLIYRVGNNV